MTNQMSYLATLAAATRLCDSCDGRGMFEITVGNGDEGGGCHLEDERCVTCDGTGKVLLIPGLRVECDGYTLFDDMERSVPDALFASTIRRLKSYKGVSDANKS